MGMLRSLVGAAAALSVGTWTVHAEDADVVWSVEHPPDVYTTLEISIFEIKFETTFPLVAFEVLVVEPSGDTVNIFSANMGQAGSNVNPAFYSQGIIKNLDNTPVDPDGDEGTLTFITVSSSVIQLCIESASAVGLINGVPTPITSAIMNIPGCASPSPPPVASPSPPPPPPPHPPAPSPPPPPPAVFPAPNPPPSIKGDPHFTGFLGQTFDVSGEAGNVYALISDRELAINAQFEQAYTDRYGGSVDPATGAHLRYQARGTWMTWLSLIVPSPDGGLNHVTVNVHDSPLRADCAGDCSLAGSVVLDGEHVLALGKYQTGALEVELKNSKSFSRNVIHSVHCDVAFDVVPPPAVWGISKEKLSAFTHLNMEIARIDLTEFAHGILGLTSRMKTNAYGEPVMKAYDKNGSGILDGTYRDYETNDILSTDFTYTKFMVQES